MGTLTGQYIADGAWTKANEATGGLAVRWPTAEALRWLNNGQREIVNRVPSASSKRATPTCVAGASRQTLTDLGITDGILPLDVVCNYNLAGSTRGRPIRKIERAWLDDSLPDWHVTPGAAAIHWAYDARDPKAIYLYPQPTSGKIELIYSATPTDLASLASTIYLDDTYGNALEWWLLYSFFSKDTTGTKNPQMAASYWQLFMGALGFTSQNSVGVDKTASAAAAGVVG